MRVLLLNVISLVMLAAGCRSPGGEASKFTAQPAALETIKAAEEIEKIRTVGYDQPTPSEEALAQPSSVANKVSEQLPPTPPDGLSINDLQEIALANNPAVAQAIARLEALRGKWIQAGLPPNPSVGYTASEIGDDGRGGQQGGYVGQEYVTGCKLQLDRAIVAREIDRAEQQLDATRLRVSTDVRKASYTVLVAQRRVELADEIVQISGSAVNASMELQKAQEIPRAGLLQTEVEQQNAIMLLQFAQNQLSAAWRQLSAVVGVEMPMQGLAGDPTLLPEALEWEVQLARITAASPELGAAMAEIAGRQAAIERARVEPIPNVTTQASVQYDDATNDTIVGLQAGIPLPLWNRNQGGIRQAQAEAAAAARNAARIELDLKRRLAEAYQRYSTARMQAETYSNNILPKSKQTLDLVQRGYSLGEVGYLDLLTAQRTFSQTNLAYLNALEELWSSWTEMDGLLLTGSLAANPE